MQTVEPPQRTRAETDAEARTRAAPAIRRHRVYAGLVLVAVLAVVVLVPVRPGSTPVRSTPAPGLAEPPGVTPPTPAYGVGLTVAGRRCGPGRRQVAWSVYAPPCQPAWHGDNGGDTSAGVTSDTIRVAFRVAPVSQLKDLYPLVPASAIGTPEQQIATVDDYLSVFNRQFELYGRRVVLVPYAGTGDLVDVGPAGDERDASYEGTTLNVFADLSLLYTSPPYADDLAAQQVVSVGLEATPASAYAAAAPYEYSPGPDCTKGALATVAVLGRQLAGLDATDAGDPGLEGSVRSYGMVTMDTPVGTACAEAVTSGLAAHGVEVRPVDALPEDLGHEAAAAQAALGQMQADGVTTVICSSCDPATTVLVMRAADRLGYHPEWWLESDLAGGQTGNDGLTRLLPADQVAHAISTGNPAVPAGADEALRAYRLGRPAGDAQPVATYALTYQALVQLFDGLQLAGPDLNPTTLAAAMRRLPTSGPGGQFGTWSGRAGPNDPAAAFTVVRWDPAVRSPLDGRRGTWVACDGDRQFAYRTGGAGVPARTPLVCSARTVPARAGRGG